MEKKRILILSNSPHLNFGYCIVFSKVAEALSEAGYDVYYLSMQEFGRPYKKDGYTILGMKYDQWASDCLEDYLKMFKIGIVITGIDLWMSFLDYIPKVFKNNPKVIWLPHVTVNSTPLSVFIAQKLLDVNNIIVPSKFIENEIRISGLNKELHYIPHGVDLSLFYKDNKAKEEMKKELGIEDKFVYFAVMRNRDAHKNPAALFKAYRFCIENNPEMKEKTKMVLVCDPREPNGVDLILLRKLFHLEDNIIFPWIRFDGLKTIPAKENSSKAMRYCTSIAFDRKMMAKLYNMADVHVNSSSGESFGLPCLESMACGVPQICNFETTGKELVGDSGAGIVVKSTYAMTVANMTDIKLISITDLAEAMEYMYFNDTSEYSKNAIKKAKEYDINKIKQMWVDLIDKVTASLNKKILNYSLGDLGL